MPRRSRRFRRAHEGIEVAMRAPGSDTGVAPVSPAMSSDGFVQAEQEVARPARPPRAQFVKVRGVDADAQARSFNARTLSSRCGNGVSGRQPRSMTSAPAPAIAIRPRHDRIDGNCRSVDDFGENADVVARQIDGAAAGAEERRKVVQLIRSPFKGHAEFRRQPREIDAAPPGNHDAAGRHRSRQPARDDRLRHQRRDLHADVDDRPFKVRAMNASQHPLEARPCEAAGQKKQALRHRRASSCRRRAMASTSCSSVSTTLVASKLFSNSVLARSMRRG